MRISKNVLKKEKIYRKKTPFLNFIKIGNKGCKHTMKDVELWKEIYLNSYERGFNTY